MKQAFLACMKTMNEFWSKKYARYAGQERHVVGRVSAPLEEYLADTQNIKDCFATVMEPGKTVLDFGCGIGRFHSFLITYFNRYLGVDLVKKLPKDVEFQSLENFLRMDLTVDAIFTCVVLQHITDDDYLGFLFRKFNQCLLVGGCLYMNEQVGDGTLLYRDEFPYINRRKREAYVKTLEQYGFSLERELPRRDHRIFKFRKVR